MKKKLNIVVAIVIFTSILSFLSAILYFLFIKISNSDYLTYVATDEYKNNKYLVVDILTWIKFIFRLIFIFIFINNIDKYKNAALFYLWYVYSITGVTITGVICFFGGALQRYFVLINIYLWFTGALYWFFIFRKFSKSNYFLLKISSFIITVYYSLELINNITSESLKSLFAININIGDLFFGSLESMFVVASVLFYSAFNNIFERLENFDSTY